MTESAHQGAADAVTAALSYRTPGGTMEQVSGSQRARRAPTRATSSMAKPTAEARQLADINELCHRMTMADTRAVRMTLCEQLKRAVAECLAAAGAGRNA